jgi:hypothetical protein
MLWGSRGLGGWFLAIALVEAINASGGIDQLLFAGKEGVASRANFDVQVALLGGAGLECLAASAANGYIDVFWVNSWFHVITFSRRLAGRIYKRDIIGVRAVERQA